MQSLRTVRTQPVRTVLALLFLSGGLLSGAGCNDANTSRDSRAITELENRVAALETRMQGVEERGAAGGAAAAPASGGADVAATGGYESVHVRLSVDGTEAKLVVNGRVVGTYSKDSNLYLDSMLNRGAVNTIGIGFSAAKERNEVEIQVKSRGGTTWNTVFNFQPQVDKLESSFDVPFLALAE